jgi:hypothetical protein
MEGGNVIVLRFVAAMAAAILVTGCAANPNTTRADPELRQLSADIERLRADDGLFTATADLGDPGLYTSGYGLAALAAAGRAVRVGLAPPAIRAAVTDQVRADRLWGSAQLALLERTLKVRLHDDADVAALRALRAPDGSYTDGGLAGDPQYTRSATAAAVSALADLGSPLTGPERDATARWLDAGPGPGTGLSVRWQLAQARNALGLPPAADLPAATDAWWAATGSRLTGPATGDQLVDACAYVRLAALGGIGGGIDLAGHRTALERILDPSRTLPGDPQVAYLLAEAWRILGGPRSWLGPLVQNIERHRLGSGLVAATQQRLGDLTASYGVQALRAAAGLGTTDPRLARALVDRRTFVLDGSSPSAGNLWLAALITAGGNTATTDARALRDRAAAVLPRPVTAATAPQWAQLATTLQVIGVSLPDPEIDTWQRDSAEHRYAGDLLVPPLVRAGRQRLVPTTVRPADLATDGIGLLATGALTQAAAALAAADALGWSPTRAQADRIAALLRPLRGCPQTPALYHETALAGCNVYSTAAAWTLQRLARRR